VAIALVTNVLAPYRVGLYALLAQRYGVELLCFGAGADYVPAWFGELDAQLAAAPFPARRIAGPRAALALGARYRAAIAPVAGGAMLPATYAGMRARRRPFVLWASVWAHPRGGARAALGFPLVRHVYRRADAVVAYGEHVRRYVAGYRGRDDDIWIAPQSVEAELFGHPVAADEIAAWRAAHVLAPDGPLALFVGRLVPEKGVRELLAAWRTVAARHPGATLALAGDGPLAGEVEAAGHATAAPGAGTPAASGADAGGIRLLGPLPRERLPVAYAAASLVVVPSIFTPRFREPWGLVCNEAMHAGTPVVATTAVGAAAGGLVRDGETGLVAPAGDPAALADAVARLLDDAPLRERLGTAGRAAVATHTHAAMADAFGAALERAGAL
jgi:glycosyltransferase involved in cell wall biosynthesis